LLRKPDIIQEVHAYLMRIAPAMKKADPTIEVFVFDECEMRAPATRRSARAARHHGQEPDAPGRGPTRSTAAPAPPG